MGVPDFNFTGLIIACLVAGAILAATAILGLPWLWTMAKPALRSLVG